MEYIKKPIRGAGGGKDGGGGAAGGVEDPNTLHSTGNAQIIDLVSEGEIEGLVDGAKSIFFDDTPLQDSAGNYNFEDVVWDERKGGQGQAYIPGFESVGSQKAVGIKIEKSGATPTGVIRTLTNSNMDAIRVSMYTNTFAHTEDNGDTHGTSVEYEISFQVDNSGSWITQGTFTKEGKTTARYDWSHRFPIPASWKTAGFTQVAIRLKRLTDDSEDQTLRNDIYWHTHTEIIDNKFSYPNSALMGIKLDAKQFGHVPRRGYEIKGVKVKVPSNYTPYDPNVTQVGDFLYDSIWNGTFDVKWTCNPAWIYYDILTNDRYGLGQFLDDYNIDKWSLYQIARYCDAVDDDGKYVGVPSGFMDGATTKVEPRFACNLYLQGANEAYKVLSDLASIFRGLVYWDQGLVSAIQDSPKLPVFHFTESNVLGGDFTYTGSSKKARHNVVLVTWNDPANGYKQTVEYVEDREGIQRYGMVEKSVIAFGCTSRGQAQRVGKWILYTERLETEGITFSTGFEGAPVRPGDLIKVSDKHRAGVRYGGRIIPAVCSDTSYTSQADCELDTTYTGIGLNDFTRTGTYTGDADDVYRFVVYLTHVPETHNIFVTDTSWFRDEALTEQYESCSDGSSSTPELCCTNSYGSWNAVDSTCSPVDPAIPITEEWITLSSYDGDTYRFKNKHSSTVAVRETNLIFESPVLYEGDIWEYETPRDFSALLNAAAGLGLTYIENTHGTGIDLEFGSTFLTSSMHDTFNVFINGVLDFASGVNIRMVTGEQSYNYGIKYEFQDVIGHTTGDYWEWNARKWTVTDRGTICLDAPVELNGADDMDFSIIKPDDRCTNQDGSTNSAYTSKTACMGAGKNWDEGSYIVTKDVTINPSASTYSTNIIELESDLDFDPLPMQVWTLERMGQVESQLYRVVSITEDELNKFTVTGLEYNESKFAAIELGDEIEITSISERMPWGTAPPPVTDINITEELFSNVNTIINRMHVSWAAPGQNYFCLEDNTYTDETSCESATYTWLRSSYDYLSHYEVEWRIKGESWNTSGNATDSSITIPNTYSMPARCDSGDCLADPTLTSQTTCIAAGHAWTSYGTSTDCTTAGHTWIAAGLEYEVRVKTVSLVNNKRSLWTTASKVLLGKTLPPMNVRDLSTTWVPSSGLTIHWKANPDIDWAYYEIREGLVWDTATVVATNITSIHHEVGAVSTGTHTYLLKAIDTTGNYSVDETPIIYIVSEPSAVSSIVHVFNIGDVNITWTAPGTTHQGIKEYEIREGSTWAAGTDPKVVTTASITYPVTWGPGLYGSVGVDSKTFWIAAKDYSDNYGVPKSFTCAIARPDATILTSNITGPNVILNWTTPSSNLPIVDYVLRYGDVWSSATDIAISKVTDWTTKVTWGPTTPRTFWVTSVDSAGNEGIPASVPIEVIKPGKPTVTNTYNTVNVLLQWSSTSAVTLPIDTYEIRYGDTWSNGRNLSGVLATDALFAPELKSGTTKSVRCSWGPFSGEPTRTFWVAPIDTAGNYGDKGFVDVTIDVPTSPSGLSVEVIDNYVKLDWNDPSLTTRQMPIENYRISRCDRDVTTCALIDTIEQDLLGPATFVTRFESIGGTYKYFIVSIDSAGNESTPLTSTSNVNEPANFVLHQQINSSLDPDKPVNEAYCSGAVATNSTDCIAGGGSWVVEDKIQVTDIYKGDSFPAFGPINNTETWEQHFTTRSWNSPADQVSAGYQYYIVAKAGTDECEYYHSWDIGVELSSSNITVTIAANYRDNTTTTVTKENHIYWTNSLAIYNQALNDVTGWNYSGAASSTSSASDFRYVKIYTKFTSVPTNDIVEIDNVKFLLSMSEQTESGSHTITTLEKDTGVKVYVDSTDPTNGTLYKYVDLNEITVNYSGTAGKTAIYDFVDEANPESFTVYIYDITTGSRTDGNFTWSVTGVRD